MIHGTSTIANKANIGPAQSTILELSVRTEFSGSGAGSTRASSRFTRSSGSGITFTKSASLLERQRAFWQAGVGYPENAEISTNARTRGKDEGTRPSGSR